MIKKVINIILVFFILQTSIFSTVLPPEYTVERIGFIESTTNKIITIDGLGGNGLGLFLPVYNLKNIFPAAGFSYINAPKPDDSKERFASTPNYAKTVLLSKGIVSNNTISNAELRFKEKYRISKPTVSGLKIMPIFIPYEPPYIPPWVIGDDPTEFNPDYKTFTTNKLYYPNETVNLMITNSVKTGDNTYETEIEHTETGATLYPVLIGHSQGGLLAYEYARQYSLSDGNSVSPVSAVISYSSPLKGVKMLSSGFTQEVKDKIHLFLDPVFFMLNEAVNGLDSSSIYVLASELKNYLSDSKNTEIAKVVSSSYVDINDKLNSILTLINIPLANLLVFGEIKDTLISSELSSFGIPVYIKNAILGTVFNGADLSQPGITDLAENSNYMKNVLLSETALATGAMQPKNMKANGLIPSAYGSIIGTWGDRTALASLVKSREPYVDLDKLSTEIQSMTSVFDKTLLLNFERLLYTQTVVLEYNNYGSMRGAVVLNCPGINTKNLLKIKYLTDIETNLKTSNPVQTTYKLFEDLNSDGLVSQKDQAIDSLNQAGDSENTGGNLYNFANYKLGKIPVAANHESINNDPKTTEAISKMLRKLVYIYEYDRNGRVVRKGTFFPKDGKF